MMERAGNQKVAGIQMNAPVAAGELIRKTDMVADRKSTRLNSSH